MSNEQWVWRLIVWNKCMVSLFHSKLSQMIQIYCKHEQVGICSMLKIAHKSLTLAVFSLNFLGFLIYFLIIFVILVIGRKWRVCVCVEQNEILIFWLNCDLAATLSIHTLSYCFHFEFHFDLIFIRYMSRINLFTIKIEMSDQRSKLWRGGNKIENEITYRISLCMWWFIALAISIPTIGRSAFPCPSK